MRVAAFPVLKNSPRRGFVGIAYNKTRNNMEKSNENLLTRTVSYQLDRHGHKLSQTPCPYWRMSHTRISDSAIFVGTTACDCCRWFAGKNEAERTIECAIPQKLSVRYQREHEKLERKIANRRIAVMRAIGEDAARQTMPNRLQGKVTKERGNLYEERYNKGQGRPGWRWVAEISIGCMRYRIRSASYERCWAWINNIREIYRAVRNRKKWENLTTLNESAVIRLAHLGLFGKVINPGKSPTAKLRTERLRNKVEAIARELKQ